MVERALARVPADAGPLAVLAELGGLEIAALAGFMVGGAAAGVPVVVDGVIAGAAALVARAFAPDVAGYLVAGHRSSEPGASVALEVLGLEPVLDLGMRLGEGSGAAPGRVGRAGGGQDHRGDGHLRLCRGHRQGRSPPLTVSGHRRRARRPGSPPR